MPTCMSGMEHLEVFIQQRLQPEHRQPRLLQLQFLQRVLPQQLICQLLLEQELELVQEQVLLVQHLYLHLMHWIFLPILHQQDVA